VQVVDNDDDWVTLIGELSERPVGQLPGVEVQCHGRPFDVADRARRLADRVQQGTPEDLSILLAAPHRHEDDAMRLTRAVRPGPQQRRLPAANRRGDNRHRSGGRAVEAGDKVLARDSPFRESPESDDDFSPP
jgi:hypothetical protein